MNSQKTHQTKIQLPPTWCASLCRNAMNQVCVECCAIRRDASFFELKPNLSLIDLSRFPMNEWLNEMNRTEKGISIAVYVSKVVEYLQQSQ